jgi:hypothetical protein
MFKNKKDQIHANFNVSFTNSFNTCFNAANPQP